MGVLESFTVTASPLVIQTDTNSFGSTSLTEVADQFYLDNSGGSGLALKYQGADVVAGQFGAWVPIGAAQTASGCEVAIEIPGANHLRFWNIDSNGNIVSDTIGAVSGTELCAGIWLEPSFNQDLNGDGTIGLTTTVIQTDRSTSLTEVANEYFLENGADWALHQI